MPGTPPGSSGTWGKPWSDERGEGAFAALNLCAWAPEPGQGPAQQPATVGARARGEERLGKQGEHRTCSVAVTIRTMPHDHDDDAAGA